MRTCLRLFAAAILLFALSAAAAEPDVLLPSGQYNQVPSLRSVLGYAAGERFTPHDQIERYLRRVDAASDRVAIEQYGTTVEGRPLLLLFVSSPQNLARRSELRAAWNKLADPRTTAAADAATLAANTPVLVWFTYGVHGNETSSAEAAMQVAYELAASEDPKVLAWLERAVIVIDPLANPDGRERYVNFFRQWMGREPRRDRFSAEHQERWPGGRYNHYLFDLNRDWAWQTQVESQARVKAFRQWSPQVHVDFHEMGVSSTYFFAPHAKPVLEPISKNLGKWYDIFGNSVAAAFDKRGIRYFTREGFDLQYPSYGDTWPALNGAVGMTYEQAGGGSGGLVVDLPDAQGSLTLKQRVTNHFTASLATIDAAAANREARLRDYHAFRQAAVQAGQTGPVRAFYLVPGKDPERTRAAVNRLLNQGIEVRRTAAEFEAEDVTGMWGDKQARKRLPAGTYVVDLAQPTGFLARTLLERDIPAEYNFFYDVSAWSMPLIAGLEAYSTSRLPRTEFAAVQTTERPEGRVEGPERAAAYVLAPDDTASLRLLSHLLDRDVKAYVALRPVKLAGRAFNSGAVIVPTDANTDAVHTTIRELARETGAVAYGFTSTRAEEGLDLGSGRVRFLRKPAIAVLADTPVQATEFGAIWHSLETRYEIPFTPIRTEELRNVDLTKYNVLVLPPDGGDGAGYSRVLDKRASDRLSAWVRDGGLLIAIRGGAVWASKNKSGLTSVTYRFVRPEDERQRLEDEREKKSADKDGDKPSTDTKSDSKADTKSGEAKKDEELERKTLRYADREQKLREGDIAGALLRAVVDTTHPLAFGMDERLAVLIDTAPILELSARGENPVYFGKESLRVSGFVLPENERKLFNTAYAVRERVGRGSVVLFADTPAFRGYTDASMRLLLNALLFGNVHDPFAHD